MLLDIKSTELSKSAIQNLDNNVFIVSNFNNSENIFEEQFYSETLEFFNSLINEESFLSNRIVFNQDNNIDEIIEEVCTQSLFAEEKLIIVRNFFQESKKDFLDKLKILLKANLNNVYVVILDFNGTFKPIYEFVNKIDISPFKDLDLNLEYLVNYASAKGYRLDKKVASYLFLKTNKNLKIATVELEKIFLYDLGYKDISNDDIDLISIDVLENEIYDIANALSKKDNNEAFRILTRCMKKGVKEESFFVQIYNQYRLMFDVSLSSDSNSDIAKKLSIHEYPVKLARVAAKNYKPMQLKTIVDKLDEIMLAFRQGKINISVALQLAVCFIMVH